MTMPDWLAQHDGTLRKALDSETWFVFFDGEPHYKLVPAPAAGKFECVVKQTENGKRIDKNQTFATAHEALNGGLDGLRTFLGW
jgi:hypothetical protein